MTKTIFGLGLGVGSEEMGKTFWHKDPNIFSQLTQCMGREGLKKSRGFGLNFFPHDRTMAAQGGYVGVPLYKGGFF
jgi:hypothetical protein